MAFSPPFAVPSAHCFRVLRCRVPWSRNRPRTLLLRTPAGFCALLTTSTVEARITWVYLTQHLPSSAFLTLPRVCFSHDLAALFHAAAALRIVASRAFPTRTAVTVSGPLPTWRCAACQPPVFHPANRMQCRAAAPQTRFPLNDGSTIRSTNLRLRAPPSGSYSVRTSVLPSKEFSPAGSRCSPGVPLLQGSSSRQPAFPAHAPWTKVPDVCPKKHPLPAFRRKRRRSQGLATSETRLPFHAETR